MIYPVDSAIHLLNNSGQIFCILVSENSYGINSYGLYHMHGIIHINLKFQITKLSNETDNEAIVFSYNDLVCVKLHCRLWFSII